MSIENTKRNRERRMAKHAKRYPQKSTKSAKQRRAMGAAWKQEASRRSAEQDRNLRDALRSTLLGRDVAAALRNASIS